LTNVCNSRDSDAVVRTQAERSAATQQALVEAAIGLLIERGWAATTAVAVCGRAGVTRGALMHHYPSLSALLADALESLYDSFTRSPRPEARTVTMTGAVDSMWRAIGDRRFKAVIEAWSAAGNDPDLAAELRPAIARFAKLVSPDGAGRDTPLATADAKAFILMAREAMLGLALGRATNGGNPLAHERVVLRRLRDEAATIDTKITRTKETRVRTSNR
jgi:AcrR family transcriptional regulator